MWHCYDCGSDFERFRVLYDSTPEGNDEYICPVCGSDNFSAKEDVDNQKNIQYNDYVLLNTKTIKHKGENDYGTI